MSTQLRTKNTQCFNDARIIDFKFFENLASLNTHQINYSGSINCNTNNDNFDKNKHNLISPKDHKDNAFKGSSEGIEHSWKGNRKQSNDLLPSNCRVLNELSFNQIIHYIRKNNKFKVIFNKH